MTFFVVEKTYYNPDDFNGPLFTESAPIMYGSLEDARAYYERATDPWFTESNIEGIGISEITKDGFEVGFTRLDLRAAQ